MGRKDKDEHETEDDNLLEHDDAAEDENVNINTSRELDKTELPALLEKVNKTLETDSGPASGVKVTFTAMGEDNAILKIHVDEKIELERQGKTFNIKEIRLMTRQDDCNASAKTWDHEDGVCGCRLKKQKN